MAKYIAFLRGINVGNIRIKMADLKTVFEALGYQDVATYQQTGNVVFSTDQALETIKPDLEKTLSATFHYEAFVLLYAFGDLADLLAQYPFERDEMHHAYLVFLGNEAVLEELKTLAATLDEADNHIAFGKKVLYWKVPVGQSTDTLFAKILGKAKYKGSTTTRNMNTLEKMV